MTQSVQVGSQFIVRAGKSVTTRGQTRRRKISTVVTVRSIEKNAQGRTRIVWKSMGYRATALV